MKKLLIFFSLLIFGFNLKSQIPTTKLVEPQVVPTSIERYNIDYEIKEWKGTIKDSTKLNFLDLFSIETKRLEKDDVEIYDSVTGLTIILYSDKKSSLNLEKK